MKRCRGSIIQEVGRLREALKSLVAAKDEKECVASEEMLSANASLIASAPDLLDALQRIEAVCASATEYHPVFSQLETVAKSAIAKAGLK